MENGDADSAVGVNVWVEHWGGEAHGRWGEWVVAGKVEEGRKDTAFKGRTHGTTNQGFPLEEIVFTHWSGSDSFWWV